MRLIRSFFSDIKTDLFHSSLLLSGSLLAQLITFAAYPIITRIYSPGQFGEFSVFLSITGILTIIATGRFEYALMLPEHETEATALKMIGLRWCLLFSSGCALISIVVGLMIGRTIPGLYFIGLYVFLSGSLQIFPLYQNRLKHYKKLAKVSVLQNVATSGGKILLGWGGLLNNGLLWGSLLGQLVAVWTISKGFIQRTLFKKPGNHRQILKKYMVFPKYRMVQALINSLSSNFPIFFITICFSARNAGYFALILGIGNKVVSLVSSALYQVLYKRFAEEKNHNRSVLSQYSKYLVILAIVSVVPSIPIILLSKSLVLAFFGPRWIEASLYLRIMLPWLILTFMATPFAFIADVFSLQKQVLIIDIVHLFFRIVALLAGLWWNNVYLSVSLYCLVSVIFLFFILGWYYLIIRNDSNNTGIQSTPCLL